jgi:NAD(P)-dependent dehydrogenase (short-subunit alcohol dehydrogenase family)
MADHDKPVWFITGCSTGFGRELARLLLAQGYRVAATARDAASLADLQAGNPNALALALDVTKSEAITQAVRAAEEKFGRIDVLVNNAGYGYLAAIEEGEDAEVRAMFETNVFGLIAMTKAVLPGMRARRQGRIINLSSIGGLVGFPGSGYYNATKFAVEGLSDALAKETAHLGIHVTLIEPGPFRTDWAGRSLHQTQTPIADYVTVSGARRQGISASSGKQPGDPMRAVEAILQVVQAPEPPRHLLLGRFAYEQMRDKLKAFAEELEAQRETTLGADFPA